MFRTTIVGLLCVVTCGCTSFRTTSLYRLPNDSVRKQKTNRKLKGLPVKLKVPSHMHVTVYEQQVLLADSDAEKGSKSGKVEAIEAMIASQQAVVSGLTNAEEAARGVVSSLEAERDRIATELLAARQAGNMAEKVKALEKLLKDTETALSNAEGQLQQARINLLTLPAENAKLTRLNEEKAAADLDVGI